jgi:hypothetical protein
MEKLTQQQKEQYNFDPNYCPYCQSEDIDSYEAHVEQRMVLVPLKCHACDATWHDKYKFEGVAEIPQEKGNALFKNYEFGKQLHGYADGVAGLTYQVSGNMLVLCDCDGNEIMGYDYLSAEELLHDLDLIPKLFGTHLTRY